ncbi:STAS domain-containing protein [Leptospira sp. 2 VSF19]|uniref:Anti-sigma factor antagonist n=1 Tax=Leptospira soteropolitanensis TaxID=2950025 RepID=A0AAW5VKQ6_9LEPT|nr:STAS domain-containing protein [Leptospira soteropolitanensis]MCW7491619.1 STAS domain-containing protein [Leptospira soteropolitanensis]MCW7499203.1 STAS domain-containing protein [Leptospira soteropolitanensis]MCW7521205.1 STAS domain-containing protein [Leptospira soteropolitanensis]MCW7525307.1 STAS domain-containing protein [Leptospira soteropolitanensis]MCW7529174.1 STAS domain-containing protein [Leptospira soteropolitanensis]
MIENWSDYTVESGDFKMEVLHQKFVPLPETAVYFELSGEINLYNSQIMKENLEILISKGINYIFLNFEQVSYIDSSGLGVCLGIHSRLMKQKGYIRIISPSEKVRYVLELTKLRSLLQIFPTLEQAISSD